MLCPGCGSVVADNALKCDVCGRKLAYSLIKGEIVSPYVKKPRRKKEEKQTVKRPSFGIMLPFVSYLSKPLITFIVVMAVFFALLVMSRM